MTIVEIALKDFECLVQQSFHGSVNNPPTRQPKPCNMCHVLDMLCLVLCVSGGLGARFQVITIALPGPNYPLAIRKSKAATRRASRRPGGLTRNRSTDPGRRPRLTSSQHHVRDQGTFRRSRTRGYRPAMAETTSSLYVLWKRPGATRTSFAQHVREGVRERPTI